MKTRVRGRILLSLAMLLPLVLALAPPVVFGIGTISVVFRDTGTNEMIDVKSVGEQFTIDLMITASPPIVQWMTRIQWDESILSLVGTPVEGTFLKNVGSTTFLVKNVEPGKIGEMTCILLVAGEASGDGDLASITFEVDKAGETYIEIYDSAILDSLGNLLPHERINGHFLLHPPPPSSPTASFTPPSCTQFRLNADGMVTVNFDASASKGGWDVLPEGHPCPIVEYYWDLDGGTTIIDPRPSHVAAEGPSEDIYVDLIIRDSPGIVLWAVTKVEFPSFLEVVDVTEGEFLKRGGNTFFEWKRPIRKEPYIIPEITCVLLETDDKAVSGDGILCTIQFHSTAAGEGSVTILENTRWIGPPIGDPYPVSGWDVITTEPYASWTYTEAKDYDVTLEVYAPDPTPPTDERYTETATAVHTIHIMPKIVGAAIDVYTQRGGQGSGYDQYGVPFPPTSGWSDAFGPQEEVTLYAYVTYNEEPVEYKPVAFEIKDPAGNALDYRTAFTDANGIAVSSFRIPWTGAEAESLFGDWSIFGSVGISGKTVMDICKFRFGYIVSIEDVIVTGSPLKKLNELTVEADLANIAFTSKDVYLTFVAHDECNVPIGLAANWITVAAEDGLSGAFTILIPRWAFVGFGTIYVNVYTKPPQNGGTPMCPEVPASFQILKT